MLENTTRIRSNTPAQSPGIYQHPVREEARQPASRKWPRDELSLSREAREYMQKQSETARPAENHEKVKNKPSALPPVLSPQNLKEAYARTLRTVRSRMNMHKSSATGDREGGYAIRMKNNEMNVDGPDVEGKQELENRVAQDLELKNAVRRLNSLASLIRLGNARNQGKEDVSLPENPVNGIRA